MISPDELRDRLETLEADLDRHVAIYVRSTQAGGLFVHAMLSTGELWLTDVGATCAQIAHDGTPLSDLGAARAICGAHEATLRELDGELVIFRQVPDDHSLASALNDIETAMAEVSMSQRLCEITDAESRRALRVPGRVGGR